MRKKETNEVRTSRPYDDVSECLPVKGGYVQYVVRPTRIINGVVTTIRE